MRLRDRLARMRQPWRFLVYAEVFGVLVFAFTVDIVRALLGGLLGAVLLTAWDALRRRGFRPPGA